jgi:hypothetical protein
VAQKLFFGVCILALPYVVFGLYLLVTGSVADYYWANVVYNTNYYIYNYPHAPGQAINPIRYAIVIANTFVNNYFLALWGVTGFPLTNPVQVTLALSSAAAVVLVILRGRMLFLIPLLVTVVFSNARSNPQSIRETDYQAFVYIVTSIFNGLFSLWAVKELLDGERQTYAKKAALTVLYFVLLIYWIATPLYFALKMEQKFFPKYMGNAPLIYSRPQIASYVNAIVSPADYVYIGPFEFEELFYLKAKQPSKYHWFLDHAAKSKIKDELLSDLNKNRPKVIVFQRDFAPWGGDPKGYNWWMTEFLDREYFRIFTLGGYRWKLGKTENFDLDATFNFDKRYQKEIIDKLLALGYIEKVEKAK